jgi:hypothetical protein
LFFQPLNDDETEAFYYNVEREEETRKVRRYQVTLREFEDKNNYYGTIKFVYVSHFEWVAKEPLVRNDYSLKVRVTELFEI